MPGTTALPADETWCERLVVREGVRLVCRDWGGGGRPVVLLHGLAGHAGEWDAVARVLARRFRVVAVDQQSLGGHTAMLTAAAHPGLVGGVVLIEAAPGGPNPQAPEEIGAWLDSWPVSFASRESAVAFFGDGPVGEGWAGGLEYRDGGWRPRFDRNVMVASLAENARCSFRSAWARITCPALVVLAESSFIPAGDVDDMLRQRPETRAVSVPGTSHDLHLEQPAVLHRILTGFLTDG